jgi:CRISPR system Cascade subunit CasD
MLRGVAIRLRGPLQSWGAASIGDDRPTQLFPTRSGVLGLVAACLGVRRTESEGLLDLSRQAQVHVRVDAPGVPLVDDQTIQDHPAASTTRQTIQSKRTYVCDASFAAVVVPGPAYSPERLAAALRRPVFAPYLGRRACPPSVPLLLADRVEALDPLGLFRDLPIGDVDAPLPERPFHDFYLDLPAGPPIPGEIRRVPVRDALSGPLPRQWRERFAVHVRARSSTAAEA